MRIVNIKHWHHIDGRQGRVSLLLCFLLTNLFGMSLFAQSGFRSSDYWRIDAHYTFLFPDYDRAAFLTDYDCCDTIMSQDIGNTSGMLYGLSASYGMEIQKNLYLPISLGLGIGQISNSKFQTQLVFTDPNTSERQEQNIELLNELDYTLITLGTGLLYDWKYFDLEAHAALGIAPYQLEYKDILIDTDANFTGRDKEFNLISVDGTSILAELGLDIGYKILLGNPKKEDPQHYIRIFAGGRYWLGTVSDYYSPQSGVRVGLSYLIQLPNVFDSPLSPS